MIQDKNTVTYSGQYFVENPLRFVGVLFVVLFYKMFVGYHILVL